MNDTAGEVCAVDNSGVLKQTREESYVASSQCLDTLSSSDVCVGTRLESRWDEGGVGEVGMSTIENVVAVVLMLAKAHRRAKRQRHTQEWQLQELGLIPEQLQWMSSGTS